MNHACHVQLEHTSPGWPEETSLTVCHVDQVLIRHLLGLVQKRRVCSVQQGHTRHPPLPPTAHNAFLAQLGNTKLDQGQPDSKTVCHAVQAPTKLPQGLLLAPAASCVDLEPINQPCLPTPQRTAHNVPGGPIKRVMVWFSLPLARNAPVDHTLLDLGWESMGPHATCVFQGPLTH